MTDLSFDTTRDEEDTPTGTATPVDGVLAALSAELDAEVPVPTVTVPVDARPGWGVKYRTNIAWSELQSWRKRSMTGKRVDAALLSRLILGHACVGFVKDGADAVDGSGEPVTFGTVARERNITVADAVKLWLATDGAVSGTSDLVYERSGYQMPDVDDEDPTED